MGFVRANVLPILKEHRLRPFKGHCLCLGQADVYFTYNSLQRMAQIAQVELVPDVSITPSHRPDFAVKGYISRDTLFKSIGFTHVSALDYSAFEGAEFEFDLNASALPSNLSHSFDVIIDHGTIEHVFHIPNCLANIYEMLKIGGRVIHSSPGSNYFDHGFYMFSPTFFYDFYMTNQWELNTLQIFQLIPQRQEIDPPFFADYEPGSFDALNAGGLDNKAYGTICIATKKPESTGTVIPQQGYYARMAGWQASEATTIKAGLDDNTISDEIVELSPPYHHDDGYCWVADLKDCTIEAGDSEKNPYKSTLKLFENRYQLGPAHAVHATIRTTGSGSYSHWGNVLYFSTHDNSDPNTNGRLYQVFI